VAIATKLASVDPDALQGEPARRGRPRSAGAHQAILTATLEVAGQVGVAGMSMDTVAQRAGVSKATIYRRWTSKEALVLDAIASVIRPFDDVDTGDVREDLSAYLGEMADRMGSGGPLNDVLPHLIEVSVHDEALRSSLDEYVHVRRAPLRRIVQRGVDRGELAAETDVDVLLDALIGPFTYRRLLSRDPIDRDFVRRLLHTVLRPR
jgi:AcrR family transcriptional regulator